MGDTEYLERRIRDLASEFNDRIAVFQQSVLSHLESILSPEMPDSAIARTITKLNDLAGGMMVKQDHLDQHLNPSNREGYLGVLEKVIEHFHSRVHEQLDPNYSQSFPNRMREVLDAYFGSDGKMKKLIDPSGSDSPLSSLKKDIEDGLEKIRNEITMMKAVKQVEESAAKTPAAGYKFEDDVEEVLNRTAKPFPGDYVERVTSTHGIARGLAGDFIYHLGDDIGGGSIVIEARDRETNNVPNIIATTTTSIANRSESGPVAGLYVVKDADTQLPSSISPWFAFGNIIACGCDTLSISIRMIRARLVAFSQSTSQIDRVKCLELTSKIAAKARRLGSIKSRSNQISKLSGQVVSEADDIKMNLESLLSELEQEFNKSTSEEQ